jgi:HSP20 family protein
MTDRSNKLPVPSERSPRGLPEEWRPLERLRHEIDRLFEDFGGGLFRDSLFDDAPFGGGQSPFSAMPAIDITETDKAYEITAELPGMDENRVEVKVADGVLSISGEKRDEKREDNKDYYVQSRSFGSFQRAFAVPNDVDAARIEATFKNGVLLVTLPKRSGLQKAAKKIGRIFNV